MLPQGGVREGIGIVRGIWPSIAEGKLRQGGQGAGFERLERRGEVGLEARNPSVSRLCGLHDKRRRGIIVYVNGDCVGIRTRYQRMVESTIFSACQGPLLGLTRGAGWRTENADSFGSGRIAEREKRSVISVERRNRFRRCRPGGGSRDKKPIKAASRTSCTSRLTGLEQYVHGFVTGAGRRFQELGSPFLDKLLEGYSPPL